MGLVWLLVIVIVLDFASWAKVGNRAAAQRKFNEQYREREERKEELKRLAARKYDWDTTKRECLYEKSIYRRRPVDDFWEQRQLLRDEAAAREREAEGG
ncbi:MAG: hypothetical protein ACOYI5_07955 [Christensenellales bacterium]|jgi:hypothetical protein